MKNRTMVMDKLNMKIIATVLLLLSFGNFLLLIALLEKHNNFTDDPYTRNTLVLNPSTSKYASDTLKASAIGVKNKFSATKKVNNNHNDDGDYGDDVTSILWSDMTKLQQDEAYRIVEPYLWNQSKLIEQRANKFRKGTNNRKKPSYEWSCKIMRVGAGWGSHHVCEDLIVTKSNNDQSSCEFISFGIANDYGFEQKLSEKFHCHGFAADPTVSYPSNIYKNVTFHQMGANILHANMELKNNDNESSSSWWITSVPQLRKALGLVHVNILKMDCEGCEYALARDIIRDDPTFFNHIDQFVVEVHLAREWLNNAETLYYYGILLKKLNDAGFRLHHTRVGSCAPEHTKTGCMVDFLCRNLNRCHNYLFAKL